MGRSWMFECTLYIVQGSWHRVWAGPSHLQEGILSELGPSCTTVKGPPDNESHSFSVAGWRRAEKGYPTGHCSVISTAGNTSRTDGGAAFSGRVVLSLQSTQRSWVRGDSNTGWVWVCSVSQRGVFAIWLSWDVKSLSSEGKHPPASSPALT